MKWNLIITLFILMTLLQKHMFSDKKWYDWLTDRAAAVSRYYGLALELQNVPSKTANNFSVLVCRPVKFGMDNDYRLPYRITYRILVVIIFGDLLQLFWRGNAITFKVRLSFKNKYVELLREV